MDIRNPLRFEIRGRYFWLPQEDDDEKYHLFIHLFKDDNVQIFDSKDEPKLLAVCLSSFCLC